MSGNSWQTTPAAQNLYNALTANNLTSPSAAQEVLKIGSLSPTFQQLVTNFVSAGGTFNFTSTTGTFLGQFALQSNTIDLTAVVNTPNGFNVNSAAYTAQNPFDNLPGQASNGSYSGASGFVCLLAHELGHWYDDTSNGNPYYGSSPSIYQAVNGLISEGNAAYTNYVVALEIAQVTGGTIATVVDGIPTTLSANSPSPVSVQTLDAGLSPIQIATALAGEYAVGQPSASPTQNYLQYYFTANGNSSNLSPPIAWQNVQQAQFQTGATNTVQALVLQMKDGSQVTLEFQGSQVLETVFSNTGSIVSTTSVVGTPTGGGFFNSIFSKTSPETAAFGNNASVPSIAPPSVTETTTADGTTTIYGYDSQGSLTSEEILVPGGSTQIIGLQNGTQTVS
jgi:YD repeat-containing protein